MSRFKRPNHPTLREQHDKCRHFTGISSNADGSRVPFGEQRRGTCRANVNYDDVFKQGAKSIALPCFHPERDNMPRDGSEWPTCPHLSFKTDAELDAETAESERWTKQTMERLSIVRPAILKHAGIVQTEIDDDEIPAGARVSMDGVRHIDKSVKGATGEFDCPICKTGKLRYSVSSYNGHVMAQCGTKDCVSWME